MKAPQWETFVTFSVLCAKLSYVGPLWLDQLSGFGILYVRLSCFKFKTYGIYCQRRKYCSHNRSMTEQNIISRWKIVHICGTIFKLNLSDNVSCLRQAHSGIIIVLHQVVTIASESFIPQEPEVMVWFGSQDVAYVHKEYRL